MLKEHDFLVDRLWVLKEVKVADCISKTLHSLSITVENGLLSAALDIIKVEKIWMQDDLGAVVEKNAIRVVRKFVTETILG